VDGRRRHLHPRGPTPVSRHPRQRPTHVHLEGPVVAALDPARSVTSACIISAITSSPTAVEAASSPSRTCSADVARCPSIAPAGCSAALDQPPSPAGADGRRHRGSGAGGQMRTCANLACGGPPSRLGGLREPAIKLAPGGGPPTSSSTDPGQPHWLRSGLLR
jgi:hypothetical protein